MEGQTSEKSERETENKERSCVWKNIKVGQEENCGSEWKI
jgi:hypothetical protein